MKSTPFLSPKEYDEIAVIAHEASEEMLSRLNLMTLQPATVLELGCRSAKTLNQLQQYFPAAEIIAVESSPAILQYVQQQRPHTVSLNAEINALPCSDHTVDFIFANLILAWQADISVILQEWMRVLRPHGLLMFTTLGPSTLASFPIQGECPLYLRDMHDIGDLLLGSGWSEPVLDTAHFTLTYKNKQKLIAEMRASGFIAEDAIILLPEADQWDMHFEVVFAHAFAPDTTPVKVKETTAIPLSYLRRQLSNK